VGENSNTARTVHVITCGRATRVGRRERGSNGSRLAQKCERGDIVSTVDLGIPRVSNRADRHYLTAIQWTIACFDSGHVVCGAKE